MSYPDDFSSIKISVASPERIREMSHGEVTKPETINYRTQRPEVGGLFCQKIFGPIRDFSCACGKYQRIRYKGVVCEKCGVEVTRASVRRERMGRIELAVPVTHPWYLKGPSSKISLVLDINQKALEKVVYFQAYVVLDNEGVPEIEVGQILTDDDVRKLENRYGYYGGFHRFGLRFGQGAEAVRELLARVDLDDECEKCRDVLEYGSSVQKREKAFKRLEVLEGLRKSGIRPEWMVLTVLPVLPPELRPMVQLDGGRFASSPLNDLYKRVINRNNRVKRNMELNAPEMILKNDKKMLQEAVDALIDNGGHGAPLTDSSGREYKSLTEMLTGKEGRFRQNLLGKRVDYSGRSVIVVDPGLKLFQCGLPRVMAIELFKPFVMKRLIELGEIKNIKGAKRLVESGAPVVWDALEDVVIDHTVLLNRAPTLHRHSVLAFEPVLVDGKAIKINPLVCSAFNADFDGDQMAVHVPISVEAQAEARLLMLSSNNVLKLSDGMPVYRFSQGMVLGVYYLTMTRRQDGHYYTRFKPSKFVFPWEKPSDEDRCLSSERYYECGAADEGAEKYVAGAYITEDEALMAYQLGYVHLQDEIKVRRFAYYEGEKVSDIVRTTVGYILFNREIPQNLGFVRRYDRNEVTKYEISSDSVTARETAVGEKKLAQIIDRCFRTGGASMAADVLDRIKTLGFRYATKSGVTVSVFDMEIPERKYEICEEIEKLVREIDTKYQSGLMTESERLGDVADLWDYATNAVSDALKCSFDKFNPVWMMVNSGAGVSVDQLKQLSGMRGLMVDTRGRIMETPIISSFREGLSVTEYFVSSHGGRKGRVDTALRTADAGYFTRRLVDATHDVIIKEDDCSASAKPGGIIVEAIKDGDGETIESLYDRIEGRFTSDDVRDRFGYVIAPANKFIDDYTAERIVREGIEKVPVRSPLTCRSRYGVCAKCYGKNMGTNRPVEIGEAVGVVAAQSISEPGMQLTMRTSHTGGIFSADDITRSLPRIIEIFEARRPKRCATICEVSGSVSIEESEGCRHVFVLARNGEVLKDYSFDADATLNVVNGENVLPGVRLNDGALDLHDVLRICGVRAVWDYVLNEVQSVYRSHGVAINDKHVEVVLRQMLRRAKIVDTGTNDFIPGETVDIYSVEKVNLETIKNGGRPAIQKRLVLGITKAALAADSFLSSASFQFTSRMLKDAAVKGKTDSLVGLKENVIIGRLIPAGTGLKENGKLSPELRPPVYVMPEMLDDVTLGVEGDGDFDGDGDVYSEEGLFGMPNPSRNSHADSSDEDDVLDPVFPDIDLSDDYTGSYADIPIEIAKDDDKDKNGGDDDS